MNPMKIFEVMGLAERVNFPPELKDVTQEDYQRMAKMIATAQFIASQVEQPQPNNVVQYPFYPEQPESDQQRWAA